MLCACVARPWACPQAQGASRYILDLRSNPGGLVKAGVDVAAMWLDGMKTVFTVSPCSSSVLGRRCSRSFLRNFTMPGRRRLARAGVENGEARDLTPRVCAPFFLPCVVRMRAQVASREPGTQVQTTENSKPALTHDPLVVLVDHMSASASEIVSGEGARGEGERGLRAGGRRGLLVEHMSASASESVSGEAPAAWQKGVEEGVDHG